MIALQRLDHLVLTVSDIDQACEFYSAVLGCKIIRFTSSSGDQRHALQIGESLQKINLHPADHPFQPAAKVSQPGSADLCFITSTPLEAVIEHLHRLAIPIIEGPVLARYTSRNCHRASSSLGNPIIESRCCGQVR